MREKLLKIQSELKAPKNQRNTFGNYNYRSCEDILEALKPLLVEHKCNILISDEIINVGSHNYIKSTAILNDCESDKYLQVFGIARESETKKGMDDGQITGSTSSYARKYALNGLFAIDDTKDSDATNKHGKEPVEKEKTSTTKATHTDEKPPITQASLKKAEDLLNVIGLPHDQILRDCSKFTGKDGKEKYVTKLSDFRSQKWLDGVIKKLQEMVSKSTEPELDPSDPENFKTDVDKIEM